MSSPPSYTKAVDPKSDRLPPYRARPSFANSEEELAELQKFAQSKLYVSPGSEGTLTGIGAAGGAWGIKSLAWGGPMESEATWGYGWPAPETAEERRQRREAEKMRKKEEKARKGSIGERLMKVISTGSTSSKEGEERRKSSFAGA